MKYSEIKERLKVLKAYGFQREQWSMSYKKTLTRGIFHYREYVSYRDIKQNRDFRGFIDHVLDRMDRELETYVKKVGTRG